MGGGGGRWCAASHFSSVFLPFSSKYLLVVLITQGISHSLLLFINQTEIVRYHIRYFDDQSFFIFICMFRFRFEIED